MELHNYYDTSLLIYPLAGLVFLGVLPLIPLSIVAMQKRSKQIMSHYWSSYMDVGNLFMDDLKGLNTLYSYQAIERYEQEFSGKAEQFRRLPCLCLAFSYKQLVIWMQLCIWELVCQVFSRSSFGNRPVILFNFLFFS